MTEKNEIAIQGNVVEETENYIVTRTEDGKFKKETKYERIQTHVPETDEEMLTLFQVLQDNTNELVTPMKEVVGKEITIANFYTSPYESFDEETGKSTRGVTTTIESTDGSFYATSSKTVYFTLTKAYKVFGPSLTEKGMKFKVTSTKMQNGNQINLSAIGFSK